MKLIDNSVAYPEKYPVDEFEKAVEACGLTQRTVQEFTSANIRDFNKVAQNCDGVRYFSVGAQKKKDASSLLLR